MANLAIKGHATRGKEVIEILEMLGGKNKYLCKGVFADRMYLIHDFSGNIEDVLSTYEQLPDYQVYTLERFLEKFPYKVGDKVKVCGDNLGVIIGMRWESGYVVYKVKLTKNGYETSKTSENLQPYEEETMEETIIDTIKENDDRYRIKVNYQFDIEVDEGEYYVVRRKPQYPKNYEECCKVLLLKPEHATYSVSGLEYERHLIVNLQRLLVCRNAYWKIAGEQIGLGKLWKPDWEKADERKYCIVNTEGNVAKWVQKTTNKILAFPTEEMQYAFHENFKELIEECKELL